jgi:hypothetical protein
MAIVGQAIIWNEVRAPILTPPLVHASCLMPAKNPVTHNSCHVPQQFKLLCRTGGSYEGARRLIR